MQLKMVKWHQHREKGMKSSGSQEGGDPTPGRRNHGGPHGGGTYALVPKGERICLSTLLPRRIGENTLSREEKIPFLKNNRAY